jgi:hypothetical protein
MATGIRSEATAAPAAAEPGRRSAPASSSRTLPATVLRLQRTAGNAAVTRALQRCGSSCGCGTCSSGHTAQEELLEERLGAGLLRSAVARRSA